MSVTPTLTLFNALRAVEAAAQDDRIAGIYLRLNGGGYVSLTALEELRAELVRFREESGKFIYAYNENYTQGAYYLASAADSVFVQPEGGIGWYGLAFQVPFYKGLMDKLDIRAEIIRPAACRYKSAVEPYFLDEMSPANREQMAAVAETLWGAVVDDVAASRGLTSEELNRIADDLPAVDARDAVELGLADGLCYEDQMEERLVAAGASSDDDGLAQRISLASYARMQAVDLEKLSADKVAIVYASGQIFDGEGYDAVYGNTLAATLRGVRMDDKVKAVVVRVNSPGGSALASDVIWREMELLKAEKPVIVSMGQYAASGGYYISCPADAIVADRTTLTGSIGVYGMIPDFSGLMRKKLGITVDGVKTNASADMSTLRPLSEQERRMLNRSVDRVYETFTSYVAAGRNLPLERVLEIAGGRVWSGVDAERIGLVDACGGLKTAIGVAVEKAGLADYRIEEVREEPTGLARLLELFNAQMKTSVERSELGDLYDEYRQARESLSQQGVVMYSPYRIGW